VEGRRLLACTKCVIFPDVSGRKLQWLLWKQIEKLVAKGEPGIGVLLSVPNNISRLFIENVGLLLRWIGRGDEILIEEFKFKDGTTITRILFQGSYVPWGKTVTARRWSDLANEIE